ncbi:helix-turn-helix domain-containing protein [Mesorhizobium sp. M0296]|uniref:helix-turn-helix domain-containing protein n=1 Tax=Mesorhizobium sp. M0296 TaxID=2956931 RepID=UPI003339AF84
MSEPLKTPWQKVHAKFGMSPAQLARVLKRHRSKISRALRDEKGLISGKDQELIIEVASAYGIPLTSDDLTPEVQ